ncbi:hypothetical protein BCU85_05575 [Vibrio lentus]|uniref:hypothetical protein n=1 Tax=Vibrio TaxID=662 RepID=UPI0003725FE1|nr:MULTISPECIES: hypothetical protein [Vibrio]MBT9241077.1 hypothetical protein [Vibrio splendidus]MCC4784209.1 hypothetical protein [Vibrio lentus]MCC4818132.1 hypothetical protein [Vibrio lentus]MCT4350911.1 hypothetical protein [Vibrio sp. NC2]MCW4439042.1 hypothetical protein [Vibrio splendidus]
MKHFLPMALVASLTGCMTLPHNASNTLSAPHGDGAIGITTKIIKVGSAYPCDTFSILMYEKIGDELAQEPETLRMTVYEDLEYVLFDNIKPGSYVVKEARCNVPRGIAVDGYKRYHSIEMSSEYMVKPNTLTLTDDLIFAAQETEKDFYFTVESSEEVSIYLEGLLAVSDTIGEEWNIETPKSQQL